MKECSKTIIRRLSNPNFMRLYFKGIGIDIGGKPDPLFNYTELFPLIKYVKTWDKKDGDAQYLSGVKNEFFDFVHSSHCLEHLKNPYEALDNWFRILKPNGYMIITVPDEDLYEQGHFPSIFNKDHKRTFTIYKHRSWSPVSINILDLVKLYDCSVEKIELLNSTYRSIPDYDQTLTPIGECGIEIVLKKNGKEENSKFVPKELEIHLDQYKEDIETLKEHNKTHPPFEGRKLITVEEADERKKKLCRKSLINLKNYKNIVGAEIGVRFGVNAKNILEKYDIKKLYLIDPYKPHPPRNIKFQEFAKRYLKKYEDKIEWIYEDSKNAINKIPDNLDFVYIDGDHSGSAIKTDLRLYYPKVRDGGLFAGHDYNLNNPNVSGLVRQVDKFFKNKNYKLNTSDGSGFQDWDWWIIKK